LENYASKRNIGSGQGGKKGKVRLKIAGSIDDFRYFKKVKKYITRKNIQYVKK